MTSYIGYSLFLGSTPNKFVSLWAKAVNNMDLSHCGQQHICTISGRYHERYRPMLYAAIEALGSLPSVALSSPIAMTLYLYMLLP
jgi:hypothetical protein